MAEAFLADASRGPPGAVSIESELAALVPADTTSLAGVRLAVLRSTPLWQKWVAGKPVAPLDEMAKETGLDLREDVSEALLASNGKDSVVLARGEFSSAELEAHLGQRGGKRMTYKGVTVIGDEDAAVAFLSTSVAVAGRGPLVRSVIDQRRRSGIPRALQEEAKGIAAGSQIWAVSLSGFDRLAQALPQAGNLSNFAKILELMEKASFGVDLRSGLNASAAVVCRSEQDAKTLSEALRGILGLARLSTPDSEPDLLRVHDGVQVSLEERTARLRVEVAQELLDKLLEKLSTAGPGTFTPGFQLRRHP